MEFKRYNTSKRSEGKKRRMVKNGDGGEIMSVRLNVKDLELIKFLGSYKQIVELDKWIEKIKEHQNDTLF